MNTRVGDREVENVIGKFGVPVMNDKKKKRGNEEWGAKMDRNFKESQKRFCESLNKLERRR